MELKLYTYRERTNKYIYEDELMFDLYKEEYVFIVENDMNKKFLSNHNKVDDNSYVELNIEKGYKDGIEVDSSYWTKNVKTQVWSNIIKQERIEELNELFKKYQRTKKLNRLLEEK